MAEPIRRGHAVALRRVLDPLPRARRTRDRDAVRMPHRSPPPLSVVRARPRIARRFHVLSLCLPPLDDPRRAGKGGSTKPPESNP